MPSIIKVVKVDVTSVELLVGHRSAKQVLTMPAVVAIHLFYSI